MSKVLNLLLLGEPLSRSQLGQILNMSDAEIQAEITRLETQKILLGWQPIFNTEYTQQDCVRAVIEVKISPERDGGFDRLAERIAAFETVESCYLMSGSYDLLVRVVGRDLRSVAGFVSERLASVEGVLSTATHFMLRAYKEQGYLVPSVTDDSEKPSVSP